MLGQLRLFAESAYGPQLPLFAESAAGMWTSVFALLLLDSDTLVFFNLMITFKMSPSHLKLKFEEEGQCLGVPLERPLSGHRDLRSH